MTLKEALMLGIAPWKESQIIYQDHLVTLYQDAYPVSSTHLLFVPSNDSDTLVADTLAYAYSYAINKLSTDFNIGINHGTNSGQTVMYPHIHLIGRYKGDVPDPRGGVRNVIPKLGNYCK